MEHYCSLQVSQLLVKLGFKQKTRSWYENHVNGWKHYNSTSPVAAFKGEFPRPTHAEAIEWLRKYKEVFIGVHTSDYWHGRYRSFAEYLGNGCDTRFFGNSGRDYKTPFKATEAALRFVIRDLLKTNKSN